MACRGSAEPVGWRLALPDREGGSCLRPPPIVWVGDPDSFELPGTRNRLVASGDDDRAGGHRHRVTGKGVHGGDAALPEVAHVLVREERELHLENLGVAALGSEEVRSEERRVGKECEARGGAARRTRER